MLEHSCPTRVKDPCDIETFLNIDVVSYRVVALPLFLSCFSHDPPKPRSDLPRKSGWNSRNESLCVLSIRPGFRFIVFEASPCDHRPLAFKSVSLRLFHLDPGSSKHDRERRCGSLHTSCVHSLATKRARPDISVLTSSSEFRVDRPTTRDHRSFLRLSSR